MLYVPYLPAQWRHDTQHMQQGADDVPPSKDSVNKTSQSTQSKRNNPRPHGSQDSGTAGISQLQRSLGNQGMIAMLQAQLKVGASDDFYEKEADSVADAVMRQPSTSEGSPEQLGVSTSPPEISRLREGTLRRESNDLRGSFNTNESFDRTLSKSNVGNFLPVNLERSMGSKIGADFSGVRIHDNPDSHAMNRQINANAFTRGNDIYFGEGQYHPETADGQRTIAHELTHTVQQGGSIQRKELSPSGKTEAIQRETGDPPETLPTKASSPGVILKQEEVDQWMFGDGRGSKSVDDIAIQAILKEKGASDALKAFCMKRFYYQNDNHPLSYEISLTDEEKQSFTPEDYKILEEVQSLGKTLVRPALTYTETISGVKFVFPADVNKDYQSMTPQWALSIYSKIPQQLRELGPDTFEFVDYYSPSEEALAQKPEYAEVAKTSRVFATSGDVITFYRHDSPHSEEKVLHSMCHEIGHNIDRDVGRLSKKEEWQKAMDKDMEHSKEMSVTEYGKVAPVEDFAETVAEHATNHENLQKNFPHRCAIIDAVLDKRHIGWTEGPEENTFKPHKRPPANLGQNLIKQGDHIK